MRLTPWNNLQTSTTPSLLDLVVNSLSQREKHKFCQVSSAYHPLLLLYIARIPYSCNVCHGSNNGVSDVVILLSERLIAVIMLCIVALPVE